MKAKCVLYAYYIDQYQLSKFQRLKASQNYVLKLIILLNLGTE